MFVMFSLMMDPPDKTRIAAQIVTGIGFLGSGIIFKDGANIKGLTTAATIWCTAAIGVLTSAGFILYAAIATGLMITVNVLLSPLSNRIKPSVHMDENEKCYQIKVICEDDKEMHVRSIIMNHISATELILMDLASKNIDNNKVQIIAKMTGFGKRRDNIAENLIGKISSEPYVTYAGWELL